LQIECQEIGSRKQKESDKISEEWLKQGYTYAGTFIFNKETNACLFRTISMHSGLFNGSIIDLFSNKTLADYLENKEGEIISGDKGEYLYLERMNF
jgi:hypothetical protein